MIRFIRPAWPRLARLRPVARYSTIHDKYAKKLAAKAERQGLTLEELLLHAQPQVEEQKRSDVADLIEQAKNFKKKKAAEVPEIEKAIKAKPSTMELDSFVDVEKFSKHNAREIEMLWKARFVNSKQSFSGSMNSDAFSKLYINARKYPTFVLPLPHKAHGVELHYVQWSFVTSKTVYCLITSLAQYKLHNEYAQPHTTFMVHTDFADRGIVLTNTVIQDNQATKENAALLVLNLQRFYTAQADNEHGAAKLELLHKFNSGDASFDVDKLIQATETID